MDSSSGEFPRLSIKEMATQFMLELTLYKEKANQFMLDFMFVLTNVVGGGAALAEWENALKRYEFSGLAKTIAPLRKSLRAKFYE